MKRVLSILIFLAFVIDASAQEPVGNLKETFDDGEFFFALEEFQDALPEYLKLYKRGYADNAYLNYKIGICYLNIPGEAENSIPYFLKASENLSDKVAEGRLKENKAPYDTYIFLGNALRKTYEFDRAITAYMKYLEVDESGVKANKTYVKKEINACKRAIEELKTPLILEKVNLGAPVNNSNSNFRAVVSGDQKSLAYMNALPFYDAIYYCVLKDGKWSEPRNITPEIKSDGDQYTTGLSFDGTTLLLSREDEFDSDIYISELVEGEWSKSKKLPKEINSKFWESHATLSPDGKRIYFASNRNGGVGEMDLYMSMIDSEGDWGTPINLGNKINTGLNEDTPFPTPDGKRLYFSSQGHNENMGGYDLYYVEILADGTFGKVVHLDYPINTPDDDLFYQPIDSTSGYISIFSNETGNGKEDIYLVKVLEQEEILAEEEPITAKADGQQIKPDDKDVAFINEVQEETKPKSDPEMIEQEAPEAGKEAKINISPLFYAFDDKTLGETAKSKLDVIFSLLKEHPQIKLKIIGYADGYGDPKYNIILSLKRAESAKEYLVSKGINENRISVIGKGSVNQLVIERDENNKLIWTRAKYNRRSEFVFTDIPDGIAIITIYNVPEELLNPEHKKE